MARKENRGDNMALTAEEYQAMTAEREQEVRSLVMLGLEQIKEGRTKEFNAVCDRLEKKYSDEAI